jgi:hypothetical protein
VDEWENHIPRQFPCNVKLYTDFVHKGGNSCWRVHGENYSKIFLGVYHNTDKGLLNVGSAPTTFEEDGVFIILRQSPPEGALRSSFLGIHRYHELRNQSIVVAFGFFLEFEIYFAG